ncbi:MAG TPA: tetratricopeptide repeat protein [Vicinamibacterales bacterium]|nr:tetratricopeptide repeat protein [Vicinamibacterales bacterium]
MTRFRSLLCGCALVLAVAGGDARAQKAAGAAASPGAAAVERRLLEAVRRAPDAFDAHHALAEFYLHAGKLAAAIPHLERAQALDPAHYANGYDLAVAYLETGALDAARRQVRRMLETNETAELLNLLGDVDARAGDYAAAAVSYQHAARMAPTEEHLFDWGDNLLRLRAYDDAVDVFAAAVRRHPGSARLHIGLGIAQYSRGRHEEAVASFCTAADLAPADPRPYAFLGEMYGVSPAQSDEITKRLARFVALKPRDANGQYYYAMSLWRTPATGDGPDLARVEALLRKAAALDARHAKARVQLGILLSEQRRWPEAIEALRAAIALEPDLAQAHFRLAQAYRRTGQAALADRELAEFERLKPRDAPPPVPE